MNPEWNERRDRLTPLEMAAKVLGARYPVLVAARIGAGCPNVPAAVAALREREPHLFEGTAKTDWTADRPPISPGARPYPESLAAR